MASRDELRALRAEVRARHEAATKKVSRLRRRGAELGGTAFDVRRDLSVVKRYNTKQLKTYLDQLNSFVDRSNAFVPGRGGVPIPAAKWREYTREERKFRRARLDELSSVGKFDLPGVGKGNTILDRYYRLNDKSRAVGANRPFYELDRRSKDISSPEALDRLIKDMRKRNAPNYKPQKIKNARKELAEIINNLGSPTMTDAEGNKVTWKSMVDKLNDYQFNILWNYTDFATKASSEYELARMRAMGREERFIESMSRDNETVIEDALNWAQLLPRSRHGNGKKK